ncbi:EamA family transporter [Ralstonia pickettii]|uniref:EamA family transporter n=1 Tax=Ralstonia pickettii TaxID=329 RepID=A0A7X2LAG6_RALPI|nr:DMT family transporter [Ralstonia pickettii]MRS98087.1 EamA family transporter [Ralstonia pickettii]
MSVRNAAPALAAALLFGASTPLAKTLTGAISPILLAGLLYLGSGLGLAGVLLVRRLTRKTNAPVKTAPAIPRREIPWLLGAILAGGVAGPALLMTGLARTGAASASLLLNVEGVFTALIAWCVFKENADRQIVLGMIAIIAGGVLLSWQPDAASLSPSALLIIAACACWAIDNNLTRNVSSNDAVLIACLKGLVAGSFNTGLALAAGGSLPGALSLASAMLIGFAGYGISLALFVVALRHLGTARTGAYFSVAPLFGVVIAFLIWPETPSILFWAAAALMAIGVWLHLRERHEHEHVHEPMEHSHAHRHDEHHQHAHDFPWDGKEPHVHAHKHAALIHKHPHYPDIHHRHTH